MEIGEIREGAGLVLITGRVLVWKVQETENYICKWNKYFPGLKIHTFAFVVVVVVIVVAANVRRFRTILV